MNTTKVIVALDFPDQDGALNLIQQLSPKLCKLKIGLELFCRVGPKCVEALVNQGYDIFLDLKFHDIPNTVDKACRAACALNVWMLNVHAAGGEAVLAAAREAVDSAYTQRKPLLIAVTVLTSFSPTTFNQVYPGLVIHEQVHHLTSLAIKQGLDGVVCSAHEATHLREVFGHEIVLVTPGIRLPEDNPDDQQRVMTPCDALNAGASYLVMGRSITKADDPLEKLMQINSEIYFMHDP